MTNTPDQSKKARDEMHENKSFGQVVAERYGNPRARWLKGHLKRGQQIRFILDSEARVVNGIASGKRKNGLHIIRYHDGKRSWMLPIPAERILIEW